MAETDTVRWGMLSTASIGRVMAQAIREAEGAELVAVAGRSADRAREYAAELEIPRSYGNYDDLLADPNVDAVYVPLPINLHAEWTIRALAAGKHVLCEKPLATTAQDASAVFDAAEAAGRQVVEGLMWRRHPRTILAQQLIADGRIGKLLHVRAALSVSAPPGDIRRTGPLGGGAHLDLGCYCISAIRLFGGEPESVSAMSITDTAEGADGADLRTAATMSLPDERIAQFDVALDFPRRDELELIGSTGTLTLPDPWLCRVGHVDLTDESGTTRIHADNPAAAPLSHESNNVDSYRIEIEHASAQFLGKESATFDKQDAVCQAAVLEAVHTSATTGTPASPRTVVTTP